MKCIVYSLIAFSFFISKPLVAQIGINTLAPDSTAALHIISRPGPNVPGQGIIIPRITQAQRLGIIRPAKALMVYDLTDKLFYMNLDSSVVNWFAINPWITKATTGTVSAMYTHSTVTNVGIGTTTPSARLDVNGSINSNSIITTNSLMATQSLSVTGFSNNALVPTGAIIMWSGTIASIPVGWALCNGVGGTPNLSGRFIVGYDASSPTTPANLTGPSTANVTNYGTVKNTGGENAHTLLKNEIPKHKHAIGNGPDGATLSDPGNHNHSYSARNGSGHETGNATDNLGYQTYNTSDAGAHSHSGVSGDGTMDGLNNQPNENRPPYYVLAFIIKLP